VSTDRKLANNKHFAIFYYTVINIIWSSEILEKATSRAPRGNNGLTNRKTGCHNKTSEEKDTDPNKWTTPLVKCSKNFTKFKKIF
jgi:hypothetical protein